MANAMAYLLRLAHPARRWLNRVTGRHTRGAKMIAVAANGQVLLIRNSYARRDVWVLPGGGVGRNEAPQAAAIRELREETGLMVSDVRPLGTYESEEEGWRDTVHVFVGRASGTLATDGAEIDAAAFFPADQLPDEASSATRRRIAEWRGERPIDGRW